MLKFLEARYPYHRFAFQNINVKRERCKVVFTNVFLLFAVLLSETSKVDVVLSKRERDHYEHVVSYRRLLANFSGGVKADLFWLLWNPFK